MPAAKSSNDGLTLAAHRGQGAALLAFDVTRGRSVWGHGSRSLARSAIGMAVRHCLRTVDRARVRRQL
jgi:hypothetical protein